MEAVGAADAAAAGVAAEAFRVVAAETSPAAALVDFLGVVAAHAGFPAAEPSVSPARVAGVRVGSPAARAFRAAGAFQAEAAAGSREVRVFQAAEATPAETADSRVGSVFRAAIAGAAITKAAAAAIIAVADFTAVATTAAMATMTSGAPGIPTRTAASIPTTATATTVAIKIAA